MSLEEQPQLCNAPALLTTTSETAYPIWNTTAGEDSSVSVSSTSEGDYFPSTPPEYTFDQDGIDKYENIGDCDSSETLPPCGVNTGSYVTLNRGASVLVAFQFETAFDYPGRDPLTITIKGSNQSSSALTLGSSWTLIYTGVTGINGTAGRSFYGTIQYLTNNDVSYTSYRLLVTSIRGSGNSVQYGEVLLLGY